MGAGREIGRATLLRTMTLGGRGWIILLLATFGTNLLDFATGPQPGARPGAAFAAAATMRVGVVIWASYLLQRLLVGVAGPFAITAALWRFVLLTLAGMVLLVLATGAAKIMAGPAPGVAAFWLASLLALAAINLLLVKALAWSAGMAAGHPFTALPALWRGQQGRGGAIAYVFVVLVLPIAALHLALTLVALRLPAGAGRLALALIDGAVQAWQLLTTLALSAVALDIAEGRSVDGRAAER